MTDAELAAIQERAAKAVAGPWKWGEGYAGSDVLSSETEEVLSPNCYGGEPGLSCGDEERAFIAHARTDIPLLLAEVERLRPLNDDDSATDYGWNVVNLLAQEAGLRADLADSGFRTRLALRVAEQVRVAIAAERERVLSTDQARFHSNAMLLTTWEYDTLEDAKDAEREACATHLERRAAEMDVDCELATVAFVLRAEAAIIRTRSGETA